jgi:glucose/arabinose dehydrogenase
MTMRPSTLAYLLLMTFLSTILQAESGLETFPRFTSGKLAGTGMTSLPYQPVPVFTKQIWEKPICIVAVPTQPAHYLVVERWGTVWLLNAKTETRTKFLTVGEGAKVKTRSLSGLTFHPDYPRTPYIYFHSCEKAGATWFNQVIRYTVNPQELTAAADSEATHIRWESNGHNGGALEFGPDGMLYITSGDGSSPGDPNNIGQTTDNLLGSIIRIDVSQLPYRVPPDNPFVGVDGIRPEVWAYGLRNPWRMHFHPTNGELWLGDNGDEQWEMVHRIERGANYGWSTFEGSHPFRPSNKLSGPTLTHTLPIVEHPHDEMRSIIGGLWYRGQHLPALKNHYLYGCYLTGKIWGFDLEAGKPNSPHRLADTRGQIVSFSEDHAKEVLIVTMDQGIFRLEASPDQPVHKPLPTLLSETGLFTSTAEHEPAPGLLPYTINAPAFWDGARRERFLGLPEDETIIVEYRPPALAKQDETSWRSKAGMDRWQMPNGSVLLQTFHLSEGEQERRIETQVSFKDGGEWRFITYRWNEAQTDATLVPEVGDSVDLDLASGTRNWRFTGRAECRACHTQRSMFVLGVNLAQMNRTFDYTAVGGKVGNQLETLHHLGAFRPYVKIQSEEIATMPDPMDPTLALEDRARAYLHINCAHCHRETGLGGRAQFQLLHWIKTADLGLRNTHALVGMPGLDPALARLIAPGQAEHSEMYRRMATAGPGKMPMLGPSQMDEAGAALIRAWIQTMD